MKQAISILVLALACVSIGLASGKAQPRATPRVKPRSVLLNTDARTPAERARVAVDCLLAEVRAPAEGRFTECSTKHHMELKAMLVLLEHKPNSTRGHLDRAVVRQSLREVRSVPERDVLLLLLGLTGDPQVTGAMAAYALDMSKPPYLRSMAVRALGQIRDPRTAAALFQVMETDPAWERLSTSSPTTSKGVRKFFSVRWTAQNVLRAFGRDNLINAEMKERAERAVLSQEFAEGELGAILDAEDRERQAEFEKLLRESRRP
jgi:hypothetical protein